MVRYAVCVPDGRRVRTALGVAAGFVVVSGFVLSTPVPPVVPPVVASGPIGASVTGPGSTQGVSPRTGALHPSAQAVAQAAPVPGAPGLHIVASPRRDSTIGMVETAVFRSPQRRVTLQPPSLKGAGPEFQTVVPVVRKVTVTADGKLVPTLANLSRPVTLTFGGAGVRKVVVEYELSGVFAGSGAASGNGVTALQPLMTGLSEALPVSYAVSGGSGTASMLCPDLPIFQQACGTTAGVLSGLPAGQSLVVITLTPTPTAGSGGDGSAVGNGAGTGGAGSTGTGSGASTPTGDPGLTPTPSSPASPASPVATDSTPPAVGTTTQLPPATPTGDPAASTTTDVPPVPTDPTTTEPVPPTTTTTPAPSTTTADPTAGPTTDPATATPPPTTEPVPVPTTTTTPIGTEKNADAPVGTEMRAADPFTPTVDPTVAATSTVEVTPPVTPPVTPTLAP